MNTLDGKTLKLLFISGANRLNEQKEHINELNVFPVPDGDTGTNMTLTILSAVREVENTTDITVPNICKAISNGSLRGARGNSGVILSQLFRGFARSVDKKEEIGVADVVDGFKKAVETAYKAVMKPKEGTILTVAKGVSDKARELYEENNEIEMIPFVEAVIAHGYDVLDHTPDLLPVLKEAGVVDSGGQGLMEVLSGAVDALTGKVTKRDISITKEIKKEQPKVNRGEISTADIKFGYCTEFIIMLDKPIPEEEQDKMKEYFLSMGDSLVLVADDEICKIHVHTNHPGTAFEKGLQYGSLSNMKVDNMRLEHHEVLIQDAENVAKKQREEEQQAKEPEKEIGFIAVSMGDGLTDIFKELGVDHIIEGGQTMNPSTEDMLEAISKVNAKNVFILPNNGNIILAAQQASDLTEDKNIIVLPTKTVPQGIAAMIGYMAETPVEEAKESMLEAFSEVKSGEVTYAVRDTSINGKEIHVNDIMGISDGTIAAVGKDLNETILSLIDAMVDEDSETLSIYYGQDITEEDCDALTEQIEEKYPELEVYANYGGQPIYYYLFSVE